MHLEEALLRLRIVKPLERIAQPVLRHRQPDLPRGHLFDGVRLVEDHEIIGEQISAFVFTLFAPRASAPTRCAEVQEKERVIHHHHVRAQQPLSRPL